MISSEEAELLIHRFITERIGLLAMFHSADGLLTLQMRGFISASHPDVGLWLTTDLSGSPSCGIHFANERVRGSSCEYFDEAEVPGSFEFGSVLKIRMPNGDSLILAEIREKN